MYDKQIRGRKTGMLLCGHNGFRGTGPPLDAKTLTLLLYRVTSEGSFGKSLLGYWGERT